jgi:hypothetical protein
MIIHIPFHSIPPSIHPIGAWHERLTGMPLTLTMAGRSGQRKDALNNAFTDCAINSQSLNRIDCINDNDQGVICVCCVDLIANDNCDGCC